MSSDIRGRASRNSMIIGSRKQTRISLRSSGLRARRVGKGALAPCPPPIRNTDSAGVAYLHKDCYPRPANLTARWQIDGMFSAKSWQSRFSRNRSPPRIRREKTPALPQEKLRGVRCLQFAARRAQAVNVWRGSFWRTGFKRLTQLGISHRAARRSFAGIVSTCRASGSITDVFRTKRDDLPRHAA